MEGNPEFWLIRHGVSTMGLQYRFSGHNDAPLAPEGIDQVTQAAHALRARLEARPGSPEPALVASPVQRALESAQVIAGVLGLDGPSTDPDLSEVDLGAWDGLTWDEVAEGWPAEFERWLDDDDAKAVGGESFRDSGRRAVAAFDRLVKDGAPPLTIVVTHSNPMKALLGAATTGRPDVVVRHAHLDFAALSRFAYDEERKWLLTSWNELG